jgi:hydrophobic/amphiphilic exporter-1 (mainly G- bacteria), HAE1 family
MRGDKLRQFRGADREVEMRLMFRATDRQSIDDLSRLPINLPGGGRTSLGAIANFQITQGPRAIERYNRQTAITLNGTLNQGATLEEVKPRIEAAMEAFAWPAGYGWKFGSGVEQNDDTQAAMLISIALAFVMIYLVMAALFESLLHPISILSSILFAAVGIVWLFVVTRTSLTLMAMIGFMILMGVVVNIGIVLISHIINLRAQGMPRDAAIVQAGKDRLRPILMTAATTLLAMLPLGLGQAQLAGGGPGGSGPAYYPMARAIIGGLAFSGVVSLFFVPQFYIWVDDFANWRRALTSASSRASRPTGP